MNLGSLVDSCQLRSGFSDSAYRVRWVNFINQAIRDFARESPWDGLENTVDLKTDGTKFLVLPHFVDSVIGLTNLDTGSEIHRVDDIEKTDPLTWAQQTAGTADRYTRAGEVATSRDPSGYLWFRSAHASDVNQLYITGLVANSGASGALEKTYKELEVTAAGTSSVTLATLFTNIFSISKASDTYGDFFFFDAGASNAHTAFLPKVGTASAFRRLALHFKPAAGVSIQLRFRYTIPDLTLDVQAPHPAVRPDYVVEKAIALHLQEQQQYQRQAAAEGRAQRILAAEETKDRVHNEPSNRLIPWLPDANGEAEDFYRRF